MSNAGQIGTIGWIDMSVDNADEVRDFYQAVVGWGSVDVSMGDYSDYAMTPPGTDGAVTGICHAKGSNAALPTGWLIYIFVADLDDSIAACRERGGEVLVEARDMGKDRFAVIRDPGGSAVALYQQAAK